MAGKKKNTEVVSLQKYKRKGHLNIGTILFGIIFVYLVFTVLIYFTKDRVSVYEVREGSILKDRNLTGMVLRKKRICQLFCRRCTEGCTWNQYLHHYVFKARDTDGSGQQ